MMMPSMSASSSSSSQGGVVSVSSVITRVEKATSEFLIGPDWTMNIDICDTINSNHWLSKDVVKAVKRRVLHKNPKVQLLSLTLLETMVKNCGDHIHFQIVDRNILQEMVKVVKKKNDMRVRDKMLILLDSWQEAFGGPSGKYPQYYWAYEELRRMGVSFPERSPNTAPIFTPPLTHPPPRQPQPGYGMPNNSSTRLDEAMAAEGTLSLSSLNSMRDVVDLLDDMLLAIDPTNPASVKDEVIVDLVEQCLKNQKKLMGMLGTTGDEELLSRGLELNDHLQNVLLKHHAIASGSPLPEQVAHFFRSSKNKEESSSSPRASDVTSTPTETSNSDSLPPVVPPSKNLIDEEEEEEDDFALLARRHSKTNSSASMPSPLQNGEAQSNGSFEESSSTPDNAIVVVDPAPPQTTSSKEQDIIDLLSITLLDTPPSTQAAPSVAIPATQSASPAGQDNIPAAPQAYHPENQAQSYNSYVAPWAVPQNQPQYHQQPQQYQPQNQPQYHPQYPQQYQQQQQYQPQYYSQAQQRPQPQPQYQQPTAPQYSAYPPPPWAATPGYYSNPTQTGYSNPTQTGYSYGAAQTGSSLVPASSQMQPPPPVAASNGPAGGNNGPSFIPSYRLFEDLNVLGNTTDARLKTNSSSMSGAQNQSMVGGGK